MSVEHQGKKFKVKKKKGYYFLDLSNKKIKDITEIKGLDKLTNLQILNLNNNQITEIKGLDKLTNLISLELNNNNIKDLGNLKGIGNLKKLSYLELDENPVYESVKQKFGGIDHHGKFTRPQVLVKYCQKINSIPQIEALFFQELETLIEKHFTLFKKLTNDTPMNMFQWLELLLTLYNYRYM